MAGPGHRSALTRVVLPAAAIVAAGVVLGWVLFAVRSGGGEGGPSRGSGGACSLPTSGPVTYQDLQCHPEAHLFYPGAKVYERLGASQTNNVIEGGVNYAFSGAILISSDPASKIYAWYDSWLEAHGWYRGPLLGGGYLSSHGYARSQPGDYGREAFEVDVDNPAQLSATLGHQVPAGGTIFEVIYSVSPYRPGATPAPSCPATPDPNAPGLDPFYCNP